MSFHIMHINEIYSNADGSIQFIELQADADGQNQLAGHTMTVTQTGQTTHTFTFPDSHLGSTTGGKTILIATQAFADLGLVTPDYILPANFLYTTGSATLRFAPESSVDSLAYTNIPTDGTHSLSGSGVEQINSPRNFAGDTGTITATNADPELDNSLIDQLGGGGQAFQYQFAANSFSDSDGDTLSYTATLEGGGALPAWLSFSSSTRTFSGSPTSSDAATLSVRVTASDGNGGSASDVFSLKIISGHVEGGTAGADNLAGTEFADSLNGVGGDDTLAGGGGTDTLTGGDNGDLLDGGAGADVMRGGDGTDTYVVSTLDDQVIEGKDQGVDTVQSPIDWTLGANLERLVLTSGAINGSGNALGNRLTGNAAANVLRGFGGADSLVGAAGNDTLNGGGAADTLNGGDGADSLLGGLGSDVYQVDAGDITTEALNEGTDTVNSSVSWTLKANFENLVLLGTANMNGTGNILANALDGNRGLNVLIGNDGADTLAGGIGNDRLTGGAGADHFVFDGALSAVNNVNKITDFAPGVDRLVLPDNIFANVTAGVSGALTAGEFVNGASAQDADDRIIYNSGTGALLYDSDGTGGVAAVRFGVLGTTTHPAISAADFLVIAG